MILQGHISRKINGREYVKHVVVLPSEVIKELGWQVGKNVKYQVKGKELILR